MEAIGLLCILGEYFSGKMLLASIANSLYILRNPSEDDNLDTSNKDISKMQDIIALFSKIDFSFL